MKSVNPFIKLTQSPWIPGHYGGSISQKNVGTLLVRPDDIRAVKPVGDNYYSEVRNHSIVQLMDGTVLVAKESSDQIAWLLAAHYPATLLLDAESVPTIENGGEIGN